MNSPTPSPLPRSAALAHPQRWAGALLAAALLPVGAQATPQRSASTPAAALPTRSMSPVTRLPEAASPASHADWWMAFDDATLNLLARWAREREAGLARLAPVPPGLAHEQSEARLQEVVASYIGVRVLSARGLAMNGVASATARQIALLRAPVAAGGQSVAERQELLATLGQRSERVAEQGQALAQQRAELLQVLAEACGLDPAELGELLAPVLARSDLPFFASAVPERLPRSILRARADVAAAEAAVVRSLRSAGGLQHDWVLQMQQAPGWIDAGRPDGSGTTPTASGPASAAARPALEEFDALLAQAALEVAQDLRSLNKRAQVQAERAQLADASRQAFVAARQRLDRGELSELLVLEQYQRLLAESDRYASASGELAMAWLRLVASTGASVQVLVRR